MNILPSSRPRSKADVKCCTIREAADESKGEERDTRAERAQRGVESEDLNRFLLARLHGCTAAAAGEVMELGAYLIAYLDPNPFHLSHLDKGSILSQLDPACPAGLSPLRFKHPSRSRDESELACLKSYLLEQETSRAVRRISKRPGDEIQADLAKETSRPRNSSPSSRVGYQPSATRLLPATQAQAE